MTGEKGGGATAAGGVVAVRGGWEGVPGQGAAAEASRGRRDTERGEGGAASPQTPDELPTGEWLYLAIT